MNQKKAISAINQAGALLVFPLDNRKEPASIWSVFFPRTKMRWEWDENGNEGVGDLWRLRADLSTTRKVVYTKWFRGRATYFSRELFRALLFALNPDLEEMRVSSTAKKILDVLEGESPLSTKEIKRLTDLQGKAREREYEQALKELWSRMLIVAFGEVDDGAFPSLAIGATRVLYDDLWREAGELSTDSADSAILRTLGEKNLFYQHYLKLRKAAKPSRKAKRSPDKSVVSFAELVRK